MGLREAIAFSLLFLEPKAEENDAMRRTGSDPTGRLLGWAEMKAGFENNVIKLDTNCSAQVATSKELRCIEDEAAKGPLRTFPSSQDAGRVSKITFCHLFRRPPAQQRPFPEQCPTY